MPAPVYSWSFPALLEPKHINADKLQELIVLLPPFCSSVSGLILF